MGPKREVYINGRFLDQRVTGVQRVALNLVLSLDAELNNLDLDFNIVLLLPANTSTAIHLKNISKKYVGKFSGHLWEQVELPLFVRGNLLINLCNTAPAFKRNQYVFIYDAAVFRFPKAYNWK